MFDATKITHTTDRPFIIKWYMVFLRYQGLTTPWDTIYYANDRAFKSSMLRKHEMTHAKQMDREGKFMFLLKYNYYWITKGYKDNPYEVEAREAAGERYA